MPVIYSSEFPVQLIDFPMIEELKAGQTYRIVIETEAPFAMLTLGNGEKRMNGIIPRGRAAGYETMLSRHSIE